jgi:hypothetical protein
MNIIAGIFNGAVAVWGDIVTEIEKDFAKVKSVLPASAQPDVAAMQSELKQAASNALGALETSALVYAPAATKAIEGVCDNALAALTGGLSVPLNPLLNSGIEQIEGHLVAAIRAWSLKAKASAVSTASMPATQAMGSVGLPAASNSVGSAVVAPPNP